jgi:hypothetical protein
MHQVVIELSYVDCVFVPVDAGFLVEILIVRPDDGPIGAKHVALCVLLIVIIDVLDENINTLFKHGTHRDK